jgi:hypothetical protein
LSRTGDKSAARQEAAVNLNRSVEKLTPMTDPLAIYLNDHLAGATGGVELFRRAAATAREPHRPVLARLADEVAADRESLIEIMAALDVPVRHYKVVAGWVGEKVGRLKLNGHLVRRAPLSTLEETEAMLLGVRGKAAGWEALRVVAVHDTRVELSRLDELQARAVRQLDQIEAMRRDVAAEVFSGRA